MSENAKQKDLGDLGCFHLDNPLSAVPQIYFEVNTAINLDPKRDEYDKAIQIGKHLRTHMKGGPGIGLSSKKTLEKMLNNEGGVCSDFSQIFNLFCLINDIKVREWGCIDRFYRTRYGHSFNEIYSTQRQQWIAIDIHKAIVFTDENGALLSAVDLFKTLRAHKRVEFVHYSDYISRDHDRTTLVYAAHTIPFIIGNNKSEVTDRYFEMYQERLSPILIHMMILLRRKNHKFIFVMDNYKQKLLPEFLQKQR